MLSTGIENADKIKKKIKKKHQSLYALMKKVRGE